MTTDPRKMTTRKRRHIDVCLNEQVNYADLTTGLDRYVLPYNALTQTSLSDIALSTEFFGATLRSPILIGAMTGGAGLSGTINRNLAAAAQQLGIGMMLGSQRIMLDSALGERAAASFTVRDVAPDVLLFGNIGLAQFDQAGRARPREGPRSGGRECARGAYKSVAGGHSYNGDTDFFGSLGRLREAADAIGYPVLLKEVGHGIGAAAVAELVGAEGELPVAGIDVAGAGGTSWSRVEQFVRYGELRYPHLADWGIPTARAIVEVREALPDIPLVASGGSARAWTRPRRSRWVPMSWRWPGRCWRPRSNPRLRLSIGCSLSSTSFGSAYTAVGPRISKVCAMST